MSESDDLELPEGTRLVHIGPPKTGTTAIQRALHNARAELAEQGICYPGSTPRPREAGWAVVGAGVPRGRHKPTMAAWDELVREVEAAGDRRVVVSNESFAVGYYQAVRKIVDGLGGDRIHVVHVVRRVDKLLNSHWQQRVQAGLTVPYEDWLEQVLGEQDNSNRHWRGFWRHHSLADVMRRWIGAAGADKVTLVVADESDHELLPRLFERFLGLRSGFLRLEEEPSNRSLSLNEIEMLRKLYERGEASGWSEQVNRHLVWFGVVSKLARSPRRGDDQRIELPEWASKRASELNDERIAMLGSLGVRVVGDPERLRSTPSAGAENLDGIRVSTDAAATAIAAAIDTGERRRLAAVQAGGPSAGESRPAPTGGSDAPAAPERRRESEERAGRGARPSAPARSVVEDMSSRELLAVVRGRVLRRLGRGSG